LHTNRPGRSVHMLTCAEDIRSSSDCTAAYYRLVGKRFLATRVTRRLMVYTTDVALFAYPTHSKHTALPSTSRSGIHGSKESTIHHHETDDSLDVQPSNTRVCGLASQFSRLCCVFRVIRQGCFQVLRALKTLRNHVRNWHHRGCIVP
jgi:hypothetical protein